VVVVTADDVNPKAPAAGVGAGLPARPAPAAGDVATVLMFGAAASVAMDCLWNRDCRNCLTAASSASIAVTAVAIVVSICVLEYRCLLAECKAGGRRE
jgi:hypothetical protein